MVFDEDMISYTVQPRAWDDIEKHYLCLNEAGWGHDRFVDLIRHIKSSSISDRLFASTSLDKLDISIYNPIEPGRETLRIEFDRQDQKWHFKYYSRPFEKVEFKRTYAAEQGIEKFDAFVKMINW